jgi:very-short-patch-repair endonuclease
MTDRVRLLLEDGTVLAEGVRAESQLSRAKQIENRKRAAESEWWDRLLDGESDGYELKLPVPVPQEHVDFIERMMILYSPDGAFYSGFNAVIKL